MIMVSSRRIFFFFYYYQLRNLLTVFLCHVILSWQFLDYFPSYIYGGEIFQRERSLVGIVECSKKALFSGDCCDKNQAIVLVVLVLISLMFIW